MAYTEDDFQKWLFLIDVKMGYFTGEFAEKYQLTLDYSLASLDELESWILTNYATLDQLLAEVEKFQALLVAFGEIFEEEDKPYPKQAYLATLLEDDHLLVITATLEGEVVGGLTAYRLPSYEEMASMIYIYDLGVKEAFRTKGIGKKLVNFLLDYAQNHQAKAVFVDTEQVDNEEAIAFYHQVGFDTQMKVLQYTFNCQGKVAKSVGIKCR